MPTYCFHCVSCEINFDELCSFSERDKIPCPKCGKIPEQVVTTPSAILFSNPKGTSKEDNFGYVAKSNYENAQALRRAAEAGNKHNHKYNDIDDISKYEGKIADFDPFSK